MPSLDEPRLGGERFVPGHDLDDEHPLMDDRLMSDQGLHGRGNELHGVALVHRGAEQPGGCPRPGQTTDEDDEADGDRQPIAGEELRQVGDHEDGEQCVDERNVDLTG